jgi:AcrR family transcriptional regulator
MGKVLQKNSKSNRQVERTKSWIFEAVMHLMNEKPYDKITVSDITEKAGIARTTFYRNYTDKDEIIFEYLNKTHYMDILIEKQDNKDIRQNTIILLLDYKYINEHRKDLKKILTTADIENQVLQKIQILTVALCKLYKEKLPKEEYLICRDKINYQITGTLKVIFDWLVNDTARPLEDVVIMLNVMNNPKTVKYPNFPSIFIRLKDK